MEDIFTLNVTDQPFRTQMLTAATSCWMLRNQGINIHKASDENPLSKSQDLLLNVTTKYV